MQSATNTHRKEEQEKSHSDDTSSGSKDIKKNEQEDNPGLTNERIHLIWSPLEGDIPDFHQPNIFPPCPDLRNPID